MDKVEFLWLVTQDQLDKLADFWECEPLEKGFDVDAEYVLGSDVQVICKPLKDKGFSFFQNFLSKSFDKFVKTPYKSPIDSVMGTLARLGDTI